MQRVYEIAREYRLSSRQVMDELLRMGCPARSYATPVTDEEVARLRESLERLRVPDRANAG